jgi:hypothetical protein
VSGEVSVSATGRLWLPCPGAACPWPCLPTFSLVSQRTILRLLVRASVKSLEPVAFSGYITQTGLFGVRSSWSQTSLPRVIVFFLFLNSIESWVPFDNSNILSGAFTSQLKTKKKFLWDISTGDAFPALPPWF